MTDDSLTKSLLPGKVVKTNSGSYRIVRNLGGGATAEVFEAVSEDKRRLSVALKCMIPTDSAETHRQFIEEGFTLARMRTLEEKAGDGLLVTPDYFGVEDKPELTCIVMEFMRGKRLSDLLEEAEQLSEPETVLIAVQLFRTLHLLHTAAGKTYNDLKFEDLWWDREMKTLKITDWGTLENASEDSIARDIQRASIYLYRLLTGRQITARRGIIQQVVGEEELEDLSWGMQEILRRLLHRNPSVRLQETVLPLKTAEDVAQALRNLSSFWEQDPAKLLATAEQMSKKALAAEGDPDVRAKFFRNAKLVLDIARQKKGVDKVALDSLSGKVDPEVDYFKRAHDLYNGTSYHKARDWFHQAAVLLTSSRLRRWAWLAHVGESERAAKYLRVKAEAEAVVDLMEKGQFKIGAQALEKLIQALPAEGFKNLHGECLVFEKIEAANSTQELGNYLEAAKAYEKAHEIWSSLPDHSEWEYEIGNLQEQALTMRVRSQAEELVEKARNSKDLEEMLILLTNALQKDPENKKAHALVIERAGQEIAGNDYENAARLLAVKGLAPRTDEYTIGWHIPELVRRSLARGGPLVGSGVLGGLPGNADSLPGRVTRRLLEKNFETAKIAREVERAKEIVNLMSVLDPERGKKMTDEVTNRKVEMKRTDNDKAKRLLADVAELLQLEVGDELYGQPIKVILERLQNITARLDRANEKIDLAKSLVDEEDKVNVAEIKRLAKLAADLGERLTQQRQANLSSHMENLEESRAAIEKIMERLDDLRQAARHLDAAAAPQANKDALQKFQEDLLVDALQRNKYMLRLDPEERWAQAREEEILKLIRDLGEDVWQRVSTKEEARKAETKRLAQQRLNQAESLNRKGDLAGVSEILREIEPYVREDYPERFDGLKRSWAAALALRNWQAQEKEALVKGEFDPELLREIKSQLNPAVAPVYWQDSPLCEYLKVVYKKNFEIINALNPASQTAEYAEVLRKLVWIVSLWQHTEVLAAGTAVRPVEKWDHESFVRGLVHVARRGKGTQFLEKEFNSLPVLADPENQPAPITEELIAKSREREAQQAQEEEKRRKQIIRASAWGVSSLVVAGSLVFALASFGPVIMDLLTPATPDPTAEAAVPPTEPPTVAPIPTLTFAPTFTPIPEVIQFTPAPDLQPAVPGSHDYPVFVLSLENVSDLTPDIASWTTDDKGGFIYTARQGQAVWTTPLVVPPGIYEIYVMDTDQNSTSTVTHTVAFGDLAFESVDIKFNYSNGIPEGKWLLIGKYENLGYSVLKITQNWIAGNNTTIDRILIVQLPTPSPDVTPEPTLDASPVPTTEATVTP